MYSRCRILYGEGLEVSHKMEEAKIIRRNNRKRHPDDTSLATYTGTQQTHPTTVARRKITTISMVGPIDGARPLSSDRR